MKTTLRTACLCTVLAILAMAAAADTTEGQVVSVSKAVLTIKLPSGESMAFLPKFVKEKGSWSMARPARTILPALEAGEVVQVTWTMDADGKRRRIDDIKITSPLQRNSRGTVVCRTASTLILMPIGKPGRVILHTKCIRVDGKWVPEPKVSKAILALKPGDTATISWAWRREGPKHILEVSDVEPASTSKERK